MTLLRYWGDAETMMTEYTRDNDQKDELDKKEQLMRDQTMKLQREKKDKDDKYQAAVKRHGDDMAKLRTSVDNGATLNNEDERRLMLWEEGGEIPDESELGIRDSMAMMLFQGGSSRINAATMRNLKA